MKACLLYMEQETEVSIQGPFILFSSVDFSTLEFQYGLLLFFVFPVIVL